MPETKPNKMNWTPVATVGAVAGGAALIIWLLTRGESGDQELAREIMEDWELEFDDLQNYTEMIYAGGRTPTVSEIAILSQKLDHMGLKEETVHNLSLSVWRELQDLIKTAAKNWWLVPVVIFTPIAGYGAFKILRGWFNNRRPPGAWPCPIDGQVFATEEHLRQHMESQHPVNPDPDDIDYAQNQFRLTSSWVQNAVAVETYYALTFSPWVQLSISQRRNISWSITSAWVYTIGAAAEMTFLQQALFSLLLI